MRAKSDETRDWKYGTLGVVVLQIIEIVFHFLKKRASKKKEAKKAMKKATRRARRLAKRGKELTPELVGSFTEGLSKRQIKKVLSEAEKGGKGKKIAALLVVVLLISLFFLSRKAEK